MRYIYFFNVSFWQPRTASAKLENNEMRGAEKLNYFLLSMLLLTLIAEQNYYLSLETSSAWDLNIYDYLISAVVVLFVLFGTLYLYHLHTSSASFIEKYFVVTVAAIPMIAVLIWVPVTILMFSASLWLYEDLPMHATWFDMLGVVVLNVATYWFFGRYFT